MNLDFIFIEILIIFQDKNWKIRKEGLDKLKEIVNTAKFITNDLGGLPSALGPRYDECLNVVGIQGQENGRKFSFV